MPTTKPRHLITETGPVARALDDAARRWPDDASSRSRLLVRLVEAGHQALLDDASQRIDARRAAIRESSGALSGAYGPGYLNDLRDDWPA